jgi:hypothetical protein
MSTKARYVHYSKSPIVGGWVVPWIELSDVLRTTAGNEGRVHANRFPEQWRSDRVYIHELDADSPILNIGTAYSGESCWAYEVDPVDPIDIDPERNGHIVSSRICVRARVTRILHSPTAGS